MSARVKPVRMVLKLVGGMVDVAENTIGAQVILLDYDVDGVPPKELCRCHLAGADAAHIHRILSEEAFWVPMKPGARPVGTSVARRVNTLGTAMKRAMEKADVPQ